MLFWLGTHRPENHCQRTAVPLCISYGRLRGKKKLPHVTGPVFLDSRGFSEIAEHGTYTFTDREYVDFARRCQDQWGDKLVHVSIKDWMCEPFMLAKTRMTIGQHQTLTVNSWIGLRHMAPEIPWVPVLQGWNVDDYHECRDRYEDFAVTRLARLPLVGLGSVCRRQGTQEAAVIVKSLYAAGLDNLHGFGFKTTGLVSRKLRLANYLRSSDSMAWSSRARNKWLHEKQRLCGGEHKGGCANCLAWALQWRERLVRRIDRVTAHGTQALMF